MDDAAPAAADGPVPLGQVIPAPTSAKPAGSPYGITGKTVIRTDRTGAAVAKQLAELLRPSTGFALPVREGPGTDGIQLRTSSAERSLGEEGYRLKSGPGGVRISAYRAAGLFHGMQTLRQLLPAAVESGSAQPGPWQVAGGEITDKPRYGYRGAMLDVSRHFFSVDKVKRYIDQMALYKVNRLHLHLSDDQGWRIAIDSWPRLTEYGGSTQVGGGAGGYYSKADYKEIVRYAASKHLTVVPEIDMPGHTNAALASYADLNCDGVAPPLYTGTDVGFSSLCVPKEITYDFVDDVIGELAAMTPGKYIHIGGDEAHSTSHEDYVKFMDRVQPIVAKHGKKVMGWHQIIAATPVKDSLAQYWGTTGTDADVIAAAKKGQKFVISPANRTYLDMKYNKDTPLGLSWAGYVEVQQSYSWDPGTYLQGAPADSVAGVEAPLWSETIWESAHIDYMAFPRLAGAAELGWSSASALNWDAYKARLGAQGPRWEIMGIDFYRSPQVPWS
ncbi:family 20 glycosylhydrolase [Streptomyces sp. A7024]|uniref:beta-N-acetylhexosaminidase n=1 Tax=Streptomyces coryli TaxID=1128680 RepID=A0A6G4U7X4_9ACTN|nr:beta-N-acetylhexosaminidase [Streptomyces coryli]NGN67281.1 family 20 glycosylhydrolase [Streptomyces coryli]